MRDFEVVVAADERGGIGRAGRLPWRLRGDVAHFKALTTAVERATGSQRQNAVIMGRRTWDSLPAETRPLPGRVNVVLTRQRQIVLPRVVVRAGGLQQALLRLDTSPWRERVEQVFIIGGAEVYRQALAMRQCRAVHLTRVLGRFDCDAYLPKLDDEFALWWSSEPREENRVRYCFQQYRRPSAAAGSWAGA